MISDNHTECVCNHLTHFAVLMEFADNDGDAQVFNQVKTRSSDEHDNMLTILTQVGMALSLTGVVLTVISYLQLTALVETDIHHCVTYGLPAIIVAASMSIAAGKDGIETFVTDKEATLKFESFLIQLFIKMARAWKYEPKNNLLSRVPWSSIVLLLFAVMGVTIIKDRVSVIFAVVQGAMTVRCGKFSVSKRMKKFKTPGDPRISSLHLKESDIEILISGRKSLRSDSYRTIYDPKKCTNTVGARSKRLADKERQCDEQPKAKKVCPRELAVGDSIETCIDFSAGATSVNHNHSYFCSQEQATAKSNMDGSDTRLPKGRFATTVTFDAKGIVDSPYLLLPTWPCP
ncbi:hypothetical protein AWC38_SpisGene23468 [Stylophora pistillata]|uniref:GAIN-B domain-containing protein n=1 Tax=Stylophora pistillata TaxID=50429 RepID=A0A2B4R8K2_STYPI|nr:hypothetical protein AWC38_SpisGene23468 [Stylophora pistillata]